MVVAVVTTVDVLCMRRLQLYWMFVGGKLVLGLRLRAVVGLVLAVVL